MHERLRKLTFYAVFGLMFLVAITGRISRDNYLLNLPYIFGAALTVIAALMPSRQWPLVMALIFKVFLSVVGMLGVLIGLAMTLFGEKSYWWLTVAAGLQSIVGYFGFKILGRSKLNDQDALQGAG